MIARRFIVKGQVQGVGFRYFAVRAARHAGVCGMVRNLPDGTVEAVAEGGPAAVDEFRRQLARGPAGARVAELVEHELTPTGRYTSFDVTY